MLVTTITLIPQSYSVLFHRETVVTSHNNYHLYPPFSIISWTVTGWRKKKNTLYLNLLCTDSILQIFFNFLNFYIAQFFSQVSYFLLTVIWEMDTIYSTGISLHWNIHFKYFYEFLSKSLCLPQIIFEFWEKYWWIYF